MIKSDIKIELLAPAKDKKTAIAAINSGADAVYIGFLKFGARKQAGNSLEDIRDIVKYADIYRVSVYVTLNTIYTDDELKEVETVINQLYDIGVSAIIIQDMGILNLNLPSVRIFASTQCHNNTLEKIKFLENTGIERVILPREFSIFDIKNIAQNTHVDLESFVHGALCVSYSGLCYLSCANGGRSANRGECAQPCRKKYTLISNDGKTIAKDRYLLSLKDLNLSEHIKDLILAGITSFKIEGRLKDEVYVRNIVSYYREKIDRVLAELNLQKSSLGISFPDFTPDVNKSFNRGFTNFLVDGKRKNYCTLDYVKSTGELIGTVKSTTRNFFTIEKNVINNGDGICFLNYNKELQGTLIQTVEGNKVFPQSMDNIVSGTKIYRNFDKVFEREVMRKNTERKIEIDAKLEIFENKIILTLKDSENNIASATIEGKFEKPLNIDKTALTIEKQILKTGTTEFSIKHLEFDKNTALFIRTSVLNDLRRCAVKNMQKVRDNNFVRKIRKNNFEIMDYPEKILDYKTNIYNSKAREFYEKRGTKITEPAVELTKNFGGKALMTSKHCIKYTLGICQKYYSETKTYKEPLILIDEKQKKYSLHFDCKKCTMTIENQ